MPREAAVGVRREKWGWTTRGHLRFPNRVEPSEDALSRLRPSHRAELESLGIAGNLQFLLPLKEGRLGRVPLGQRHCQEGGSREPLREYKLEKKAMSISCCLRCKEREEEDVRGYRTRSLRRGESMRRFLKRPEVGRRQSEWWNHESEL